MAATWGRHGDLRREVVATAFDRGTPRAQQASSVVALQQAHDEADHEVPLPRLALGGEKSQGDHRVVGDALRAVGARKELVPREVLQEQERPDALVAVGERVILDDEVEQIGRAQLDRWIERLPVERLLDGAEDRGELFAAPSPLTSS